MKKLIIKIILMLLVIIPISCVKEDIDSSTNSNITNTKTVLFSYSENTPLSSSTVIKILPTAFFTSKYNTLIAQDASGKTIFEINLTAASVASYSINASNVITYTAINPYFVATSGTVNIITKANGKVSGNFEGFATGSGSLIKVYGEFNDVPMQ